MKPLFRRAWSLPALLAASLAAVGCTADGQAVWQTVGAARRSAEAVDRQPLNPAFSYLRVTGGGQTALLVLGYLDPSPAGTVEVWYSGDRQVVRLQGGRVVGATGLPVEWSGVRLPALPTWGELIGRQAPLEWARQRDVSPGYRHGLTDRLALRPMPTARGSALVGRDPASLRWFEERSADGALPPARYAVDPMAPAGAAVVYGEQCLDATFCLTWQRWPPPGKRP